MLVILAAYSLFSQANYLRSLGVKKGDAVSIYMPMVCELPIAMLACARIGAVHSVVFGGFSAEALAGEEQWQQLITCNGSHLIIPRGQDACGWLLNSIIGCMQPPPSLLYGAAQ